MGKTSRSSSRHSRHRSKESKESKRSEKRSKSSSKKMGKNKKKKNKNKIHKANDKLKEHREVQTKIDKLKKVFNDLRNQSNHSLLSTQEDTVILLEDSVVEAPGSSNCKRKLSESNLLEPNKCIKLENNFKITVDDDVRRIVNKTPRKNLDSAPKDCSTPIARTSKDIIQNNNTDETENFNAEVNNLTKEINRDSYLTIDLTTETTPNKSNLGNTVIDLDSTNDNQDCTFVSMSNANLSLSGESDVTVLHNPYAKKKKVAGKSLNTFVNGIAKLNATDKGKLLELITQNIFKGCQEPKKINSNTSLVKERVDQATETVEDVFIKEVILGEKHSRNSIGSNIYNPEKVQHKQTGLRLIVIDGSNVAMEHGKGKVFSVKGLKICIDYFLRRGHVVKAFVPRFRCRWGKSTEPRLLDELERRGLVVYTPSREIQGRMVTSYDDRYIVQCAAEFDAIIVSGDNYRDLLKENPRWRFVIENRLLQFTWVDDMIMFPRDPLGRNGPSLEAFLKYPPPNQHPRIVVN